MNRPMLRSRLIHPGVAYNEALAELDYGVQLLYERLWMMADRNGRFEYRPEKIRSIAFPTFRGNITEAMEALCATGLIRRYEVDGKAYGDIPTFLKYQKPHPREARSEIPPYERSTPGEPQANQGEPQARQGLPKANLGASQADQGAPQDDIADAELWPTVPDDFEADPVSADLSTDADQGEPKAHQGLPKANLGATRAVPRRVVLGFRFKDSSGGVVERGSGGEKEAPAPPTTMETENETPVTEPPPIARKQPSPETYRGLARARVEDFPLPGQLQAAGDFTAGAGAREQPVLSRGLNDHEGSTFDAAYLADINYLADSLLELAPLVHLPNPDDEILRQILAAGQGATGEEIAHLLAALYKRGRLSSMRSWGYLPVLVRQWATAA